LDTMDIQQVMRFLPHRFPFLLVDRVIELETNKRLVALKNVTINEPFFQGHFPVKPVMPGVLIIEAMAQATGLLAMASNTDAITETSLYYFVGIDKARFKRQVVPGDQLRLEVVFHKKRRDIWFFSGTAMVDDQLAAAADVMCASREI
jgi:3-hydroxyacyl-[acyl-carrier-protein] dehydratase